MIKENKTKYNEFIKDQRKKREKEFRIRAETKSSHKPPSFTFDDIYDMKDLDRGMRNNLEPPKLNLPSYTDQLYVEKPIGKYEPMHDTMSKRNKNESD